MNQLSQAFNAEVSVLTYFVHVSRSERDTLDRDNNDGHKNRRNNQTLNMFYRMQHNMVSISPANYLAAVQSSGSRRPDVSSAVCPERRLQMLFLPFPATVRMWNALPASVIQTGTLSSFRSQWSSGSIPHCSARGPAIESRCGQLCLSHNHCDLQPWARAVCTFPAVPRSTQPSTLRGTVNEYQLSE